MRDGSQLQFEIDCLRALHHLAFALSAHLRDVDDNVEQLGANVER